MMDGIIERKVDPTLYEYKNGIELWEGQKEFKIGYKGKEVLIPITVEERAIDIIITGPNKKTYWSGEKLDLNGLKVEAIYKDGRKEFTNNYTILGQYENLKPGIELKILCKGIKKTIPDIVVKEEVINSIKIENNTYKKDYIEGENFNKTGLKAKVFYESGKIKDLNDNEIIVLNGENLKLGQKTVKLRYNNIDVDIIINVREKKLITVEMHKKPTKIIYELGDENIDLRGGEFVLKYDNNFIEYIKMETVNVEKQGLKNAPLGNNTITLKYLNRTFKYNIEVKRTSIDENTLTVKYNVHAQDYGWMNLKNNGEMAGTEGESKRLEALNITIYDKKGKLSKNSINYKVHVQDYGWMDLKNNGEMAGTEGESKRLEAIQIYLDPNLNKDIVYRVHVQDYGWMDWKRNGEIAGTQGESKRIEAIQIKITPKISNEIKGIKYLTHVQDYGWMDWKKNGEIAGTEGKSKRLEALKIEILDKENKNITDKVLDCQVHIQDYGWTKVKSNGEILGTQGESKRIEAIYLNFRRGINKKIKYRVHVQDYGWMDWKCNGEIAGTCGQSKRIEAIQIKIE